MTMTDNVIHQLFYALGVNLDWTPETWKQAFTMALQFIAALWFIWWFVKYLFSLMHMIWR